MMGQCFVWFLPRGQLGCHDAPGVFYELVLQSLPATPSSMRLSFTRTNVSEKSTLLVLMCHCCVSPPKRLLSALLLPTAISFIVPDCSIFNAVFGTIPSSVNAWM